MSQPEDCYTRNPEMRWMRSDPCHEDLNSDCDQNDTAQYRCLFREPLTEFFPEQKSDHADHECYNSNDQRARESSCCSVPCCCKAYGKCVDGGRNSLYDQGFPGQDRFCSASAVFGIFFALIFYPPDSLEQHLTSDIQKKKQRNPGNEFLKYLEI